MKKIVCLLIAVLMCIALTGCNADAQRGWQNLFGGEVAETPSPFEELKEEKARIEAEQAAIDARAAEIYAEDYGEPMPTETPDNAIEGQTEENTDCETCRDAAEAGNGDGFKIQLTGKSNVDPARIPADIKALMRESVEASELETTFYTTEDTKYALKVLPNDFYNYNPDVYDELYLYPYNLYSSNYRYCSGLKAPKEIADADYGFKTNVECLELYGEDALIQCMKLARKYVRGVDSLDYSDPDKNREYAQMWGEATGAMAGVDILAKQKTGGAKKGEIIARSDFGTDISLVYQDAEGCIRVRGTAFLMYDHIIGDDSIKAGSWQYDDREIIIRVTEDGMKVKGDAVVSTSYGAKTDAGRAVISNWLERTPA